MNKLNCKWKIKNYVTYYCYLEGLESLYVFLCYKLYIYIVKLLYSIPTTTTAQLCIEYENKTKHEKTNLRSRQPGVRSFGEREITVLICSQNPCRLWLVFVYYILIFDLPTTHVYMRIGFPTTVYEYIIIFCIHRILYDIPHYPGYTIMCNEIYTWRIYHVYIRVLCIVLASSNTQNFKEKFRYTRVIIIIIIISVHTHIIVLSGGGC